MNKKSNMNRKICLVLLLILIGIIGCASTEEAPDTKYQVFTNKVNYEQFKAAVKTDIGDISMASGTYKGWYLNNDEFLMWRQKVRTNLKQNSLTKSEIRALFSKDGFSGSPLNTAVNVITKKEHGVIIRRSGDFLSITLR